MSNHRVDAAKEKSELEDIAIKMKHIEREGKKTRKNIKAVEHFQPI